MAEEPEDFTLRFLRRLDQKMDRVAEDLHDLKRRMTTLEQQVAHQAATGASHYASLAARLDRVEERLDRIERRLDLAHSPAK